MYGLGVCRLGDEDIFHQHAPAGLSSSWWLAGRPEGGEMGERPVSQKRLVRIEPVTREVVTTAEPESPQSAGQSTNKVSKSLRPIVRWNADVRRDTAGLKKYTRTIGLWIVSRTSISTRCDDKIDVVRRKITRCSESYINEKKKRTKMGHSEKMEQEDDRPKWLTELENRKRKVCYSTTVKIVNFVKLIRTVFRIKFPRQGSCGQWNRRSE